MRNKLLGIALIAVLLAASLLACASQKAKPSAEQRGGTLVIGFYQEPDNLNVNIANQTVSFEVNEFINDALLGINAAGEYIPELAKEVPTIENGGISADGLTITYHLIDN
ncbi:MAG: peptide ABC transporter substrate-binding protein, partial [Acidimicrobiia bacterium]